MESNGCIDANQTPNGKAVAVVDMQSGRTVGANRSFATVLGVSHDELVDESLPLLSIWGKSENLREFMSRLSATQHGQKCYADVCMASGEKRTVLFAGEVLYFEGKPHLLVTVDIVAAHQQLNERLSETPASWQCALDTIQDCITIHDMDYTVLLANKAAAKILARLAESCVGRKCHDIFHGTMFPPKACPSCKVLETCQPCLTEMLEPYLNRYIEVEAMPWLGRKDSVKGLIHIVRDATRRNENLSRLRHIASLVEHSDEPIAETDLYGVVKYANEAFASAYGYEIHELIGKHISSLQPAGRWQDTQSDERELFSTGLHISVMSHICRNGRSFAASTLRSLVKNEKGEPAGIRISIHKEPGTMRDVQPGPHIGEYTKELLDSNPDWQYWLKADSSIGYISPSVENVSGYSPQEFIDDPTLLDRMVLQEDHDLWMQHRSKVDSYRRFHRIQFRIRKKDGTIAWIEHACCPMNDDRGTYLGTHITNRDVTEVKVHEQAIIRTRDRWHRLFEESGTIVVYCDSDGVIMDLNQNAAKRLGGDIDTLVGRSLLDLLGQRTEATVAKRIAHVIESGEAQRYEEVAQINGGPWKWYDSKVFPIKGDGEKTTGVQIISHEVTSLKRAEKRLLGYQHNLEKILEKRTQEWTEVNSRLVREIAKRLHLENEYLRLRDDILRRTGQELHDGLGQRLTGISLMVKSMEDGIHMCSPADYATFERVTDEINVAIEEIKAVARGLYPADLQGRSFVDAMRDLVRTTEATYGISCTFKYEKNILTNEHHIPIDLYHIAKEAVTNAVKHAGARNIDISLECGRKQSVLIVTNDGKAFPAEAELEHCQGIGIKIMAYRADVAGGVLDIRAGDQGGTIITCRVTKSNNLR